MGEVLHFSKEPKESAAKLKDVFLEWLATSVSYRLLQDFSDSVDTYDIMTRVERIRANPGFYSTEMLVQNLYDFQISKGLAPEIFARVKILKERFGLK